MKILVIDQMHASLLPLLAEQGLEADYQPDIRKEEVPAVIAAYEGLIVRSKISITAGLLAKASKLKFVARAGAGMDQIDVEAARQRGITLLNAPEGNRDAVAEHAVGMLLCLFNKLHLANAQVRQGIWDREGNRGIEIMNKTVGLIGYGNTGQAFARRLGGFGCKILAYDKFISNFSDAIVQESRLEDLFEQTDILSLHIPLTPESQGWVNEALLNRFRKNMYLINTARGEIVRLPDLVQALKTGKILGACLDVLENEKLTALTPDQQAAFNYLSGSDNILFTPHVAGWTHESYYRINQVLAEKIAALRDQ